MKRFNCSITSMPILDVSVKVSNARIVDGGDCGGAFLT
jgi:hypothetical protein